MHSLWCNSHLSSDAAPFSHLFQVLGLYVNFITDSVRLPLSFLSTTYSHLALNDYQLR